MPQIEVCPGQKSGATSHTTTSQVDSPQDSSGSRQVTWEAVHEYVERVATTAGFPMVGTLEWCSLPDDDERKAAAIYSAAEHWALYVEGNQRARAEASRDVSAAADWPGIARQIRRSDVYIPREVA